MVYGSRSLMNWAQKLRAYGKAINDMTTTLGHIIWSDDGENLKYKDLDMEMDAFRGFALQQVKSAQNELRDLLLVNPKGDVITMPEISLQALRDNPSIGTPSWSFVKDLRNETAL